jgi:hypothetical protein
VLPGGAGGGFNFGLVTVPNVYDQGSVVDFGPLRSAEAKALGLGAGLRQVDDMHSSAAHITRQLGQGKERDHYLYWGWARLRLWGGGR